MKDVPDKLSEWREKFLQEISENDPSFILELYIPLFFKSASYIAKKDLSKISSTFFGAKDFRKTKLAKYELYKEVEEETEEETDTADEASDEKAE